MKRNTIWIVIGAILLLAAVFFLPSLFYGRGGMMSGYGTMGNNWMNEGYEMGNGYGMMGSGMMMGGSWIISIVILFLVITGGVWLGNTLSNRGRISSSAPEQTCPNCDKAVATDWSTCPYCSTSLK